LCLDFQAGSFLLTKKQKILKKRTLTNLCNEHPTWWGLEHEALDEVVAAAYGLAVDLPEEDVLAGLFSLNQEPATKH